VASRGCGKMKVALQISKVNNPFEVFFDREKLHYPEVKRMKSVPSS